MSKLPNSFAAILGSSINHYLSLDPGVQASISVLENKSIALKLREFSFPVYFHIENKHVKVLSEFQEETDVKLSTTLPGLLKMTLASDGEESVLGSEIDMSGDMEVGRQFRDIFKNIDIDWEEIISKYTGDLVAHKLGNGFRQFSHWMGNTRYALSQDITEFMQEESQQLPSRSEVESFISAVGDLRMAVERAEAKLKLLASQSERDQGINSVENEQ